MLHPAHGAIKVAWNCFPDPHLTRMTFRPPATFPRAPAQEVNLGVKRNMSAS